MPQIAKVEPLTTARAVRGPFDYLIPEDFGDVKVGSLLLVRFGRRELLGVVTDRADSSDLELSKLSSPLKLLGLGTPPELIGLSRWVAQQYCSTPARALSLVLPPGIGLGKKPRKRLRTEPRRLARPENVTVGATTTGVLDLNPEQRSVVDRIVAAIEGDGGAFLLHGVTGSGKTEVYLQAAAAALARDRGVIVLVPEIALTPQTVGRIRERFGDQVAVLHSQLGVAERYDEWLRLRTGQARICVGPRSAVFAPVEKLGLIVVDEEHDPSYKNEGDPRYDARPVAERRAQLTSAVLVAGSATPRPESYARLEHLRLPQRADGSPLPPVEIIDMRRCSYALHSRTRAALAEVRERGEKAIVLLNRRGWSNFLSCRICGHVWSCPNCEVTLVLHRAQAELTCHHCGWREQVPDRCPECDSVSVARHGSGTERLEQELGEALGETDFPIFRLDSDVTTARGRIGKILGQFDRAPAGVLLGTQMVAKGHDFPAVTLAVVLDADQTLRFPDFRAEERTFQLVAQLAGRAGRGPAGGRVLVQTLAPDASSIRYAANHDSEGFLEAELAQRELLGYPPTRDVIRIVCSATDAGVAATAAEQLRQGLDPPDTQVLGPAPLFRLRGRERVQIVLKTAARERAIAVVRATVEDYVTQRRNDDLALSVDVDPQ